MASFPERLIQINVKMFKRLMFGCGQDHLKGEPA